MTVREAIHRVWQKFTDGTPSDDSRLRARRVYSALLSARAFVIDKFLRTTKLTEWNYTTLSCVPLEKTTAHECGCIPAAGCSYYKTTCTLPDTLGTTSMKDVTTLDGLVQFSETTWGDLKYTAYNKYTSKSPKFFVKNNRIFLVDVPYDDLKVISLRGVFSDPIAARANCTQCPDSSEAGCLSLLDTQFPIESRFESEVIERATMELQKIAEQDATNDTTTTVLS